MNNSELGAVTLTGWPPRHLSVTSAREIAAGDGELYADFIESSCRVTKDSVAANSGEPLVLRPWQHQLLGSLLARREDGRYRHRQGLVGMGRKNGKSALGAGIALAGLVLGPDGGEVYSCAAEKEQARIVFGTARRMIELEPKLRDILKVYRDVIEYPQTGSIYRCLSAEAYSKEGLNPHLVIFDEVHAQPDRELWDVMALAMGARVDPLMLGITTPGVEVDATGEDSLCYSLYKYGTEVAAGLTEDPSFFMAWWEPRDPNADYRLETTWQEGNPGYGDLQDPEDFRAAILKTPEPEFRTKRCSQWVTRTTAWLPAGAWDACRSDHAIPGGAAVTLGFDGSLNNDSTALVVVEVADRPHISVVDCWERPKDADDSWKVPIVQVEDAIRAACRRWQVREVACDPYRWQRTIQVLGPDGEGMPLVGFPQSPERMIPATQRFFEAVVNRQITHSGDARLSRHITNAVLRSDARGSRLVKDSKNSSRRIDLAIASVMGLQRAAYFSQEEPQGWGAL